MLGAVGAGKSGLLQLGEEVGSARKRGLSSGLGCVGCRAWGFTGTVAEKRVWGVGCRFRGD